jgi:hypothetical protein
VINQPDKEAIIEAISESEKNLRELIHKLLVLNATVHTLGAVTEALNYLSISYQEQSQGEPVGELEQELYLAREYQKRGNLRSL